MLLKKASYIFYCLYFFTTFFASGQGEITVSSGSYIINMGVEEQTIANALRPYGLVHELVLEEKIPVIWSINPSKTLGGVDFTYNGTDYKGGSFIIESKFIEEGVRSIISNAEDDGVVGVYTESETTVPFYARLVTIPGILIFNQSTSLVTSYLNNANIFTNYEVGNFNNADDCADLYIFADRDAQQNEQEGIYDFLIGHKGNAFIQGKSVSTLEALSAPVSGSLNLLTTSGLFCYDFGKCGFYFPHDDDYTGPVTYNTTLGNEPIMQFLGEDLHLATEGEESWFLPVFLWNENAQIALRTQDALNDVGAKVVFGRADDDGGYGRVMYVAGDDLNSGTAGDVAAQRLLFNYILLTGIDKSATAALSGPDIIIAGEESELTVSFQEGFGVDNYTWRSTCGLGISGTGNSKSVTADGDNINRYTCNISVVASDECGHSAYATKTFAVYPVNEAPAVVNDEVVVVGGEPATIKVLDNDSDPQPDDQLAIIEITQQPVNGTVQIVDDQLIYTGNNDTYIMDSLYYKVCDDHVSPMCGEGRVVIINELQINTAPEVVDQTFYITAGTSTELCIEAFDTEDDNLLISSFEYQGMGEVNATEEEGLCLTYNVADDFSGMEEIVVEVCDIRENALCTEAALFLVINANHAPKVSDQGFTVVAGVPTQLCVEAYDEDGDDLALSEIIYNNSLARVNNGDTTDLCFNYETGENVSAEDELTIRVCDQNPEVPFCTEVVISILVQDLAPPIEISRAITPDGNGANDIFFIKNIEAYPENVVRVFDRYGGVVFETSGYSNDNNHWTGYNGSKEAPAGTYFYLIELRETGERFKGYVELIK